MSLKIIFMAGAATVAFLVGAALVDGGYERPPYMATVPAVTSDGVQVASLDPDFGFRISRDLFGSATINVGEEPVVEVAEEAASAPLVQVAGRDYRPPSYGGKSKDKGKGDRDYGRGGKGKDKDKGPPKCRYNCEPPPPPECKYDCDPKEPPRNSTPPGGGSTPPYEWVTDCRDCTELLSKWQKANPGQSLPWGVGCRFLREWWTSIHEWDGDLCSLPHSWTSQTSVPFALEVYY